MTTGSYGIEDLLSYRTASAASFGLDTISKVLQADLAAWNIAVQDQLSELAIPTTAQQGIYGVAGKLDMVEMDEFGAAPSSKLNLGETVGFPLQLFSTSLGWTSKFMEIATPGELADQYLMVRRGHQAEIVKQIKKALYKSTNYTFVDRLTNGVSLSVKRLCNADSATYPAMPDGSAVDGSTHDHYNFRAAGLASSDIKAMVADVTEHGYTKGVKIAINLANKAAFITAASTDFVAAQSPFLIESDAAAIGRSSLTSDLQNQLIGIYDRTVEVWVKPWAVEHYYLCWASGESEKPLAFRQRPQAALQGLRFSAEYGDYPLICKTADAEFGFGVFNRLAASILYTGNTSWADPTIS